MDGPDDFDNSDSPPSFSLSVFRFNLPSPSHSPSPGLIPFHPISVQLVGDNQMQRTAFQHGHSRHDFVHSSNHPICTGICIGIGTYICTCNLHWRLSTSTANSVPISFQSPIPFSLTIAPALAHMLFLRACDCSYCCARTPTPTHTPILTLPSCGDSIEIGKGRGSASLFPTFPTRVRVAWPPPTKSDEPCASQPSPTSTACFSICLVHSTLSYPRPL